MCADNRFQFFWWGGGDVGVLWLNFAQQKAVANYPFSRLDNYECYDFLNIFAENFGVFDSKQS
jgi:hypothetical protein